MKLLRSLCALCAAVTLLSQPAVQANAWPAAPAGQPEAVSSADGVTLTWQVGPVSVVKAADGSVEVTAAGFDADSTPGAPRLPFASKLVALPENADAAMEIVQMPTTLRELTGELSLNPPDARLRQDAGQAAGGQHASFAVLGTMRGVRLGRVVFYPAVLKDDRLEIAQSIQVRVTFSKPAPAGTPSGGELDEIARALQSSVANPALVQPIAAGTPSVSAPDASTTVAAVEVSQRGLTSVSYEQLLAAGFPVAAVNPLFLKLYHGSQEVRYEWAAAQDGVFSAGEKLRFYADPQFSRWMANDVYLLKESDTAAAPMPTRSAAVNPALPAGAAWVDQLEEQNKLYTPDCECAPTPAGRDGDRWVWDRLMYPGSADWPSTRDYTFTLASAAADQAGELTLWVQGFTDTPAGHTMRVSLNGIGLTTFTFSGKVAYERQISLPAGRLQIGANTLTLSLPAAAGKIDGIWMDAFSIHHALGTSALASQVVFKGEGPAAKTYALPFSSTSGALLYDVTQPAAPVRLTGFSTASSTIRFSDTSGAASPAFNALTSSQIHTPAAVRLLKTLKTSTVGGANYIIIAPEAFHAALAPLVTLRKSQGLSAAVEDVQAIYDQYNYGRLDPQAIKSFLDHTYRTWNPLPTYALLVGDGTVDPRNYLGSSFATYLPPFLADIDPYTTEGAADNRYVTFDGPADFLPDMLIGRLPANSAAETTAMVTKLVNYEKSAPTGLWKAETLFVSDNTDSGGNFPAMARDIATEIPTSVPPRLLLLGDTISSAATLRTQLFADWKAGTTLIVYSGHSSVHFWASESFLHISDVPTLKNGLKLPILLEMTCFTGSFQMTSLSALDEALLRQPDGGAVGVWGSTSMGISTGHKYLAKGFLHSLIYTAPRKVGTALSEGRLLLLSGSPDDQYLIDTYIYFGDPASRAWLDFNPSRVTVPVIRR